MLQAVLTVLIVVLILCACGWFLFFLRKRSVSLLRSPLAKRVDELQDEVRYLCGMFKQEGESESESRYKEIVAELLFLIFFRLDSLVTFLALLLGVVIGHFLAGLF